jgi:hypothetical protein
MQPTVQPQTMKSATSRSSAQLQLAKAATTSATPATAPKTGARFLDYLMTALAGRAF